MSTSVCGPRLAALLGALTVALLAAETRAQSECPLGIPWCQVGPNGKVVIAPPRPSVTVGGSAGGGVSAQHTGGFSVPTVDPRIELEMRARWDAYFKARADLRLKIRAQVEAEFYASWRQRWQQTPDPYVGRGNGGGGGSGTSIGVPAFSFAPICYGLWTGPVPSSYIGLCPFVRFALDSSLVLEVGANLFVHDLQRGSYYSAHLHPALLWSFVEGTYASGKGAHAYLRAGLDAGLPWGAEGRTPSAFAGGEVGLGVESLGGSVGVGLEVRGQVRRGFADRGDLGYPMSRWHTGLEQRVNLIFPF